MYQRKSLFLIILLIGFVLIYKQQFINSNITLFKKYANSFFFNKNVADVSAEKLAQKESINLEINDLKNNVVVNSRQLVVKGKTVPSADVFVNQNQLKADNKGNFLATLQLDEGWNNIIIVVNDAFGNYTESELAVNLETLTP